MRRAGPVRVIAVDDERNVLQVLEMGLDMAGYQVRTFEDLTTSLAAFLEDCSAFDLAILDQHLADGTGLELATQMRAKNATMRIVLASGRPNEELTRAAQTLGLLLLPKPFSLEGLLATLDAP
jgi:DNA-binding response OmpR family regulator